MLRRTEQTISWLAIAGTILPSMLYLTGTIDLNVCHWLMLVATILWFAATPLWMGREPGPAAEEPAT